MSRGADLDKLLRGVGAGVRDVISTFQRRGKDNNKNRAIRVHRAPRPTLRTFFAEFTFFTLPISVSRAQYVVMSI